MGLGGGLLCAARAGRGRRFNSCSSSAGSSGQDGGDADGPVSTTGDSRGADITVADSSADGTGPTGARDATADATGGWPGDGSAGDAMEERAEAGAGTADSAVDAVVPDAVGADGSGPPGAFTPCGALGVAQVRAAAYLPDGSAVAAGLAGAVVKFIDPTDHHEIRSLFGHSGAVNAVVVSADGSTIASASDDGTVRLWRASDGAALATLTAGVSPLRSVAISPDGTRIAAGAAGGELYLWNRANLSLVASVTVSPADAGASASDSGLPAASVSGVAFAAAGSLVLATAADGSLKSWSSADLAPASVFLASGVRIGALAVSPDGTRAVTGDIQGTLTFWHMPDGAIERHAMATQLVTQLAFAPDGTRVYCVDDGTNVTAFPAGADGAAPTLIAAPIGNPAVIAPAPDSSGVFVAGEFDLYRVDNTGRQVGKGTKQGPFARSLAFWPDDSRILIGGDLGAVVRSLPGGAIAQAPAWSQSVTFPAVDVSPDGTLFATGDITGLFQLWSTATWSPILNLGTASAFADGVAFSPDGLLLAAVGSSGFDEVYRMPGGAFVTFLGSSDEVQAVAFSPDGSALAFGTQPGELDILRTSDWASVARIPSAHLPVSDVAFAPDGRLVATTGDDRVTLWPVGPSPVRQDILNESGFAGRTVAYSGDGTLLAAGGGGGSVRLWALPGVTPLSDLATHGSGVVRARFSHDGRQLAVAYADGTVWLWCRP